MRSGALFFGFGLALCPAFGQDFLNVGPSGGIYFSGSADDGLGSFRVAIGKGSLGTLGAVTRAGIGGSSAGLRFKLDHVDLRLNSPPNFLVISPNSGAVPAFVNIGLNERIVRGMGPGLYSAYVDFSTIDQSPATHSGFFVYLTLSPPPAPVVGSAVNTASYLSVPSPGAMVSIFGTHLGQTTATSASYDEFGLYPKSLAGTTVTFNGIAAPLLFVSTGQVNALVPYGLAGEKTAEVKVTRSWGANSLASAGFTTALADTSPSIFTATQNGSGQGAILQYPDNSYNSAENPTPRGSVITLFATGLGTWTPPLEDGAIHLEIRSPAKPVSLTIGGQPARVIYAGSALYEVAGLLQINAYVPEGVGSGTQPVVLKVGDNDSSQQSVTIAIK